MKVNDVFAQRGQPFNHLSGIPSGKARAAHVAHADQGSESFSPDYGHAFEQPAFQRSLRELFDAEGVHGQNGFARLSFDDPVRAAFLKPLNDGIYKRLEPCDNRAGAGLLLQGIDEIGRIGAGRAVLNAGVAGNAFPQNVRRLAFHEKPDFARGPVPVVIDVAAPDQTIAA